MVLRTHGLSTLPVVGLDKSMSLAIASRDAALWALRSESLGIGDVLIGGRIGRLDSERLLWRRIRPRPAP